MSSRIRLVSVDPGLAPTIEFIDTVPLVIGRHPGCDVRLDDRTIARRHCLVRIADVAGSEGIIKDLGSLNGTRINGKRIESARFYHGDRIALAKVEFLVIGGPDRIGAPRS
jgi:pSer/pThr/pTyr-binding forkhead associated (FHA) protein